MTLLKAIIQSPSVYLETPAAAPASPKPGQQALLQDYLERARVQLTAQEQVRSSCAAGVSMGNSLWCYPDVLHCVCHHALGQVDLAPTLQASPLLNASSIAYDMALALMALGFSKRMPHYIYKAERWAGWLQCLLRMQQLHPRAALMSFRGCALQAAGITQAKNSCCPGATPPAGAAPIPHATRDAQRTAWHH